MKTIATLITVSLVVAVSAGPVAGVTGTTVTYQGKLLDGEEPAKGSYNIDVGLWDAAWGGSQIGSTLMFNDVPVSEGLFTIELDFGAGAFDNSDRWLEISVNGSELTPRQPISRAPYSIQTRGLFVDDGGSVGIGTTIPTSTVTVAGANNTGTDSAAMVMTNTADSTGRSYLVGSSAEGLFQIADMTAGGATRFVLDASGRLGIGTAWPEKALHFGLPSNTDEGIFFAKGGTSHGSSLTVSGSNNQIFRINLDPNNISGYEQFEITYNGTPVFTIDRNGGVVAPLRVTSSTDWPAVVAEANAFLGVGVRSESMSTTGQGVVGLASANTGDNYGVIGKSESTSGTGAYGFSTAETGTNYGVYGKSDSSSGYDFYAGGAGTNYGSSSSIRWKHNVEPIDDPLSMVAQPRGLYFDWDEDHSGHHDVGMIAEEVGVVLSEIVNYEENGIGAHGMGHGLQQAHATARGGDQRPAGRERRGDHTAGSAD